MGTGSFDQSPPLTTTHILTHLVSNITNTAALSSLSVFSRLVATEQGNLFSEECLREVIRNNDRNI